MKYIAIAFLFLLNNEILSLIALSTMSFFFIADILKARCSM